MLPQRLDFRDPFRLNLSLGIPDHHLDRHNVRPVWGQGQLHGQAVGIGFGGQQLLRFQGRILCQSRVTVAQRYLTVLHHKLPVGDVPAGKDQPFFLPGIVAAEAQLVTDQISHGSAEHMGLRIGDGAGVILYRQVNAHIHHCGNQQQNDDGILFQPPIPIFSFIMLNKGRTGKKIRPGRKLFRGGHRTSQEGY